MCIWHVCIYIFYASQKKWVKNLGNPSRIFYALSKLCIFKRLYKKDPYSYGWICKHLIALLHRKKELFSFNAVTAPFANTIKHYAAREFLHGRVLSSQGRLCGSISWHMRSVLSGHHVTMTHTCGWNRCCSFCSFIHFLRFLWGGVFFFTFYTCAKVSRAIIFL